METPLIRFGGQLFEPLTSGALFWRAENALLVADLHFEKMSSFARRSQLLPPYDTGATLRRLERDLDSTGANTVVSLGDSFHRDEGTMTLQDADRLRLDALLNRARWVWIAGNHDPAPHALGGDCVAELTLGGITLTHQPRRGALNLIAGHLHPSAHLLFDGRSVRRPCFVHDTQQMILPAYGVSTGTLNILSLAFANLLMMSRLDVVMLGRDRLYPVSARRLIA